MMIRILLMVLLGQVLSHKAFCQVTISDIDRTLSEGYKKLRNDEYGARYDSSAPGFRELLTKHLSMPIMLEHNLVSLDTLITIVQSPDKKIKFYSWDALTGGTWHEINAFAQYRSAGNKVSYRQIDTDNEAEFGGYTDSEIYEVYQISENSKTYYVTFGWGTHGNGAQHVIVQVFRIAGEKLVKCKVFHPDQDNLVFEYPRSQRLDIRFEGSTNTISFNEFVDKDGESYPVRTGNRKSLKFSNGVFK